MNDGDVSDNRTTLEDPSLKVDVAVLAGVGVVITWFFYFE